MSLLRVLTGYNADRTFIEIVLVQPLMPVCFLHLRPVSSLVKEPQ